jgi:vancomycin permeability regulator SanA
MGSIIRSLAAFLVLPGLIFLAVWGSEKYVAHATSQYRFTDSSQVPVEDVAVVFGAGIIQRTSEVGVVLKGRMDTAIHLYNDKKVSGLVLSGDNTRDSYDEVTPMVKYAREQGVLAASLTEDRGGSSTYDTCYRLAHTLKVKKAVLVTNEFHLPRAVYTCRKLGVDAVGLATPNYAGYEYNRKQREPLATVKMLIDLYVAPPQL